MNTVMNLGVQSKFLKFLNQAPGSFSSRTHEGCMNYIYRVRFEAITSGMLELDIFNFVGG
jgi:hypothetical protein